MIEYIFLVISFIIAIVDVFGKYKYKKKIKQKRSDIKYKKKKENYFLIIYSGLGSGIFLYNLKPEASQVITPCISISGNSDKASLGIKF